MHISSFLLFVTYHTRPSLREAFLSDITTSGILDTIRAEEGCIRYDYFLSAADPDQILLVEEWASEAMQQTHMQTPHMAKLAQIKEKYVDDTTVEKYTL